MYACNRGFAYGCPHTFFAKNPIITIDKPKYTLESTKLTRFGYMMWNINLISRVLQDPEFWTSEHFTLWGWFSPRLHKYEWCFRVFYFRWLFSNDGLLTFYICIIFTAAFQLAVVSVLLHEKRNPTQIQNTLPQSGFLLINLALCFLSILTFLQ